MMPWKEDPVVMLSDQEFATIAHRFEGRTGIRLTAEKRTMVTGRLQTRLRARDVPQFADYLTLLDREPSELTALVDALTTHETSFYREPRHFEVLAHEAHARASAPTFRVWSAACSTGEEACSAALTLADTRAGLWEVVGTDIGDDTVTQARAGLYQLDRGLSIPLEVKRRHALRGVGDQEGRFCLRDGLRARQRFEVSNLLEPQTHLGQFDVAFVRNVLIYFDPPRQRLILHNVLMQLRAGGLLLVGHAESALGIPGLVALEPSVYRQVVRSAP
jgi:chemotaxis protein methyltransferase CheR